jgi:hypothetical protein
LHDKLGHTKESLRQRRAFYSLRDYSFAFQSALPHSFAIWEDDIARRVHLRNGSLSYNIEYVGEGGAICKGRVAIPPGREVALPSSTVFCSGRLWWPGMSDPGIDIVALPNPIDRLQNYGNNQGIISLGPIDFGAAAGRLGLKQTVAALPR